MSRIGLQPIKIESNTKVEVEKGGRFKHLNIKVEGPKGTLEESVRKGINVKVDGDEVFVERKDDTKRLKALHGLYRSLIANMVDGVTKGFSKELQLVGVGYRAELKGDMIELSLGLTHPVEVKVPEGMKVEIKDKTELTISGIDKTKVGQFAASIREFRKPEPYKGKGIRYKGEQVRRKAGKAASTE